MSTALEPDITGDELNKQRFQMLEDIAKELSGEVVFPTCFDVATRIRKALRDADQPISKIVDQLRFEPLIGSKLLSMANSIAFNPNGNEVRDVKGAVSRLGLETVRSTAMAITMNQMLRSRDMVGFGEMAQHLWNHSMQTASATYVIAKRLTRINPDEAMMAGLVHDLGAFYMLYRATQYSALRTRPESMKYVIAQWHESIGLTVLNVLGMHEDIIEAVRDHDVLRPIPEKPRSLSDVVYIGNLLVGGRYKWMHLDTDENIEDYGIGEPYLALQDEIKVHAAEMNAVFG